MGLKICYRLHLIGMNLTCELNCCGVWKGNTELGGNLEGVLDSEAELSDLG